MKYIYSISQMSKLSLTLHTFSVTGSVVGLFLILLTYIYYKNKLGKYEELVVKVVQKLQQSYTRSIYIIVCLDPYIFILFYFINIYFL